MLAILLACFLSSVLADITYIEPRQPLPGKPSPPGSPWPFPQSSETESVFFELDPSTFRLESNAEECDIIREALLRYRTILFTGKIASPLFDVQTLPGLSISVKAFLGSNCSYPRYNDDESYVLHVTLNKRAYLLCNTVWGALRGLETFSQLVYEDSNRLRVNATHIVDWPRFSYRGIMLDTARHFISTSVIKQNLDSMSYNKMNVFHWHIVDDQSFPFESLKFPNLSAKGAYQPSQVYRQTEIKEIIEYARLRGIRVIPEFDTPGHTQALGKSFPDLLTSCFGFDDAKPNTALLGSHPAREVLDPTKNATFDFLREFFLEVRGLFVDDYIHLGMDEVYYNCWRSSPLITKFMKQKGFLRLSEVEQYYSQRTMGLVEEIGYRYMAWQDPTDNGVVMAPDTVIEIWKEDNWEYKAKEIAEQGYKMVLSACWYLNYISYGEDWKKYYMCEPHSPILEENEKEQMIGGEACFWAEYIDDTNLLARLWPRASAVAERLWSSASMVDVDDAAFRLDQQRCRMLRRGISAQPIINGFCKNMEYDGAKQADALRSYNVYFKQYGYNTDIYLWLWFLFFFLVSILILCKMALFRKILRRGCHFCRPFT